MMHKLPLWSALPLMFVLAVASGCKSPNDNPVKEIPNAEADNGPFQAGGPAGDTPKAPVEVTKPAIATAPGAEPDFITVQHILIGFKGSVPGKNISRSKDEAEALAKEVLAMAQAADANFGDLVKKYTADSFPGIYKMANHGVSTATLPDDVLPRGKMVAAFGDVGFPLQVGQVGLANYDLKSSPYGWHIIKRVN